jgi:hypothetical protein
LGTFAAWCSRERRCWFSYLQIQNAGVGEGSTNFIFAETFHARRCCHAAIVCFAEATCSSRAPRRGSVLSIVG